MSNDEHLSERQRVTRTLDELGAVLGPYVDSAMTAVHGEHWDQRVSKENAERRGSRKPFPVSKTDLQVMLNQIQFQRIPPWARPALDRRTFACLVEIKNARNRWAHGESGPDENARLVEQASALLRMLGLPVPEGLRQDPRGGSAGLESKRKLGPLIQGREISDVSDAIEEAVERLGEGVRQPAQFLAQWTDGTAWRDLGLKADPLDVDSNFPALVRLATAVAEANDMASENSGAEKGLPRVVALLAKSRQLGVGHEIQQLILARALEGVELAKDLRNLGPEVRAKLASQRSAVDHTADENLKLDAVCALPDAVFDQDYAAVENLRQEFEETRVDPGVLMTRAMLAAGELPEGVTLVHQALAEANECLFALEEPSESALLRLREAIAQRRTLAGLAPAQFEREKRLASLLTIEGRLCNDLGRTEEAIRAFARADEIIDRYPLADPFVDPNGLDDGT